MKKYNLLRSVRLALFWPPLIVALFVAFNLKHPRLFFWRDWETPALLLVASLTILFTIFARRHGKQRRQYEPWLRLGVATLIIVITTGQEFWFYWQKSQIVGGMAKNPVEQRAAQRIGRHFITGFRSFENIEPLARQGLIGGIYLTRRNLAGETFTSLSQRIAGLQTLRRKVGLPPLVVLADQEGGVVAHLSPMLPPMPPLATLAGSDANLEQRGYEYGRRQGEAMADLGFTMNLAPVVDLKPWRQNTGIDLYTQIERRAIAADPRIVIRLATAYCQGLLAAGIQPTVKHFPGLRQVSGDTHLFSESLPLTWKELTEDLSPFRQVPAKTGAAIMLSHIRLTAIDPKYPVSLSRVVVHDILRNRDRGWNFQGLLITDDLNMEAAYRFGIDRAATLALNAGIDLLLVSYDPDQYYRAIYGVVKSHQAGRVDKRSLAESATRLDAFGAPRIK
ncbi:MAG TPA: beta-hexosaminidase [Desulfobulbaceae bacterium]|nr:beta-hexosaminidase [Desulfobulbaceae bacterium]